MGKSPGLTSESYGSLRPSHRNAQRVNDVVVTQFWVLNVFRLDDDMVAKHAEISVNVYGNVFPEYVAESVRAMWVDKCWLAMRYVVLHL